MPNQHRVVTECLALQRNVPRIQQALAGNLEMQQIPELPVLLHPPPSPSVLHRHCYTDSGGRKFALEVFSLTAYKPACFPLAV